MTQNPRRLPTLGFFIGLLLLTCCLINLALLNRVQYPLWPEPEGVLGVGFSLAQASLLAAWLVWGRWTLVWRVVTVALGALGLSPLAASSTEGPQYWSMWFGIFLVYVGMIASLMVIARLSGQQLTVLSDEDSDGRDVTGRRRWQFSIWSLLSVMSAVAVTLVLLRWVDLPPLLALDPLVFYLILTITAVLIFLASCRHWLIGLATVSIVGPLAGMLIAANGFPDRDHWRELIAMSVIHSGSIHIFVTVLKVGGLRLSRVGAQQPTTAIQDGPTQTLEPVDLRGGP